MSTAATVEVGDSVIFTDATAQGHSALVTAVWGQDAPAINIVFVSGDDKRTDQYGRQLERHTSVVHQSRQAAHGMYWRLVDEPHRPSPGQ